MKKLVIYTRSAATNKDQNREQVHEVLEYLVQAGHIPSPRERCMEHPPHIKVFTDNGWSGFSSLEDRPEGRQLIDYCASHPQPSSNPGIVAIADSTRMGRFDVAGHAETHRQLEQHGWRVHCASLAYKGGRDYHDAPFGWLELEDASLDRAELRKVISRLFSSEPHFREGKSKL